MQHWPHAVELRFSFSSRVIESRSFGTDTDTGFAAADPMNDVIRILDPRRSVAPDSNGDSSTLALEVGSVTTGPRDSTEAASRSSCFGSDPPESLLSRTGRN